MPREKQCITYECASSDSDSLSCGRAYHDSKLHQAPGNMFTVMFDYRASALALVRRSEGFPERDISSLHAMGYGSGQMEKLSTRHRRRRRRHLMLPGGAATPL